MAKKLKLLVIHDRAMWSHYDGLLSAEHKYSFTLGTLSFREILRSFKRKTTTVRSELILLKQLFSDFDYIIVGKVVFSWQLLVLVLLFKDRLIWHTSNTIYPAKQTFWQKLWMAIFCKHIRRIAFVTNASKDMFIENSKSAERNYKYSIVYHACDVSEIDVDPLKEISGVVHLAFVGRLVPEKGMDAVVKLTQFLTNRNIRIHFDVVGSGPSLSTLGPKLEDLCGKENVSVHGNVSRSEVINLLTKNHFLISPSYTTSSWSEFFGMNNIEAAYCCCVPLVTAEPGPSEIFQGFPNVFDYAVFPENADAFINKCVTNQHYYKQMQLQLKTFSEKFSKKNILRRWECLID